jgi:hypothetical protein
LEGAVSSGNFDGLCAGKDVFCLHYEGEFAVEREVVFCAERYRKVVALLCWRGLKGEQLQARTRSFGGDVDGHGSSVFELDGCVRPLVGRDTGLADESQTVAVVVAGGGSEGLVCDFDGDDLLKTLAGKSGRVVALVNFNIVEVDVACKGSERNFVSIQVSVLLDGERVVAWVLLFERDVKIERVFCVFASIAWSRLEGDIDVLLFITGEGDVLDTTDSVAVQGEVIVLADEELVVADDLPVFVIDLLNVEGGPFKGVESPITAYGTSDDEIGAGADLHVGLCRCCVWVRLLKLLARLALCNDKTAFKGVGREGNISRGACAVEVQEEIVREAGGEDERRAYEQQRHLAGDKRSGWRRVAATAAVWLPELRGGR